MHTNGQTVPEDRPVAVDERRGGGHLERRLRHNMPIAQQHDHPTFR